MIYKNITKRKHYIKKKTCTFKNDFVKTSVKYTCSTFRHTGMAAKNINKKIGISVQ